MKRKVPRPRPKPGTIGYMRMMTGKKLDDETIAHIWVLREEGRSMKEIAASVRCGYATVWKTLHSSKERYETIIAAEREERTRFWKSVENNGLKTSLNFIKGIDRHFFNDDGTVIKSKIDDFVVEGAKWARAAQIAASDAAKYTNLFTGDPTERVEQIGIDEPGADEAVISKALALGEEGVSMLPPSLQAKARLRVSGHQPP